MISRSAACDPERLFLIGKQPRNTYPMAKSTLFLCGDVMLGRGIDQVLPHPGDPLLREFYVSSAKTYVRLAEEANGPIPAPITFSDVWGDALTELKRAAPQARIINLETSVTKSRDYTPKGINYKMNPENIACLTAAGVDCCVIANNHILDFGEAGLCETLGTLKQAGIRSAGAGRDAEEARAPAVIEAADASRVLVFAFGCGSSGIPPEWAAGCDHPGVNLLPDLSDRTLQSVAQFTQVLRRKSDLLVASIHWDRNWGYQISRDEVRFAHGLIDIAGFSVVHGHSSHHPKAIEVYRNRPIFYGCGDFINDYEGIGGHEEYRGRLALMYFPRLDVADGGLVDLELVPLKITRFQLQRAPREDAVWLSGILDRESARFGTHVSLNGDNSFAVRW
jgi:poly-gamma-glutamate capsule biosynthesis protein CapA/YwtB (metallophosphatase superfamily)